MISRCCAGSADVAGGDGKRWASGRASWRL